MKRLTLILTLLLVAMLTTTTAWAENGILAGEGTCVNPYIISDIADWNYFTTLLNNPIYATYYADKHFKLGADIGYYNNQLDNQCVTTTAAENPDYPFCGSFNGNGHTIWIKWDHTAQSFTPDPNDDSSQGIALFHYAGHGCHIHDLTVRGNIWSSFKYTAGFISYIKGEGDQYKCVTLSRCRSCVTIMSYVDGDATSAGLVGFSGDNVYLNIVDCLFDGTISSGNGTHFCGMVGYQSPYGHIYIGNSFVSPFNVYLNSSEGCYTFCAYNEDFNYGTPCFQYSNNYYTATIGKKQGSYVSSSANPESVAAMLGYWKVVGDQPLPYTIADVAPNCMLFSGFNAYNFNIPYNTLGNDDCEGYRMVVDGDRSTQWRIKYSIGYSDHWVPISVDFSCDMRFIPKGYIFTTGRNTYSYPETRPESWNLYGYSETYNRWVLLDSRDADDNSSDGLPKFNVFDELYLFKDNLAVCQKFRLEITDICRPETVHSGLHPWAPNTDDFEFALSEIKIFGIMQGQDLFRMDYCSVGGLMPCYAYTGDPIALNYTVTNHTGDKLIENYHYTDSLVRRYGDIMETVTEVRAPGEYELVLKGMGAYSGTKSRRFVVGSPDLPMPMIYEKDEQIDNSFYYCVKMLNNGQIDLDLSETDPDFVQPFYVFNDGGKYGMYSSYCDSKLHIKAPEGYILQVSGYLQTNNGYPYDYLVLYDGDSVTSPTLGSEYYSYGAIGSVLTSGQDVLLYFKSDYNSYANGLNLMVRPVSLTETHNIAIIPTEHGSMTATPANNVTVKNPVTLNINPENGYLIQDMTVVANGFPAHYDNGLWYSGNPYEASFDMPADDVTVTPTFEATYALSVNMPDQVNVISDAKKVYIPENVNVFKVYDPGGPEAGYYTNVTSYLLLIAQEGKMMQISGNADLLTNDRVKVYNGNSMDQELGYCDENHKDLGMLISTGNEVLIYFSSDYSGNASGFEFTVNVIDHNTDDYGITLANPTIGGTVSISGSTAPTTAHVWDTITLNIVPSAGYLLNDLIVSQTVGGNTYQIAVNGGLWHDTDPTTAWFVMPANNVTVTPYFTDNLTAEEGGLSINMPRNRSFDYRKIVNVPDDVTSFKVYDDGGKDGNYSTYNISYMEVRVPDNYRVKLTGTVTCSNEYTAHDYFEVFEYYPPVLTPLGKAEGYGTPEGEDIGEIFSSGYSMVLHFNSEDNSLAGLDLRVDIDDGIYPYTVTIINPNPILGCHVHADVATCHVNDTVTLTVESPDNYLLQDLLVQDADGNDIPLSQGLCWYNGNNSTTTFTMPGRDIIITYNFVEKGYQYVNMPKKNTVDTPLQVTFPEGITSCKVYDDGGAEANYSDYCNGYALFTAPEGKVWQLTGKVKSEHGSDYMVPYDGDTTTHLIDFYYYGKHTGDGEDIGGLVTFSNQMLIRFYSDFLVNYEGLDLTAKLIDPITRTIEGYAGAPAGQDRWAFISAPMKYYTLPENVVNLIPETDGIPDPTSSHYDLYRFNQSAEMVWENYKSYNDEFSLDAGQGYLYANMYTKTLQFGGAINIEDSTTVALAYDANAEAKGWNLVGNPLTEAAYVNKPYYRMDEFGDDIEPVEYYSQIPIPICTGVMVKAEGEDETITFSKTMQQQVTHQGSLHIAVSALEGSTIVHDRAIVSFNRGTKLGKFVFNANKTKLYIQQEDEDYAIAFSEKQGEVPLGLRAAQDGEYTLTVTPDCVETDYLHLIDNKTGADVDLLTMSEYTFSTLTSDDDSRFRLVFSAYGLHEGTETVQNFAYYANGEIRLTVETQTGAILQVIDMTGRVLLSGDAKHCISTAGMAPGVYVLRLFEGQRVMTQKIVIP